MFSLTYGSGNWHSLRSHPQHPQGYRILIMDPPYNATWGAHGPFMSFLQWTLKCITLKTLLNSLEEGFLDGFIQIFPWKNYRLTSSPIAQIIPCYTYVVISFFSTSQCKDVDFVWLDEDFYGKPWFHFESPFFFLCWTKFHHYQKVQVPSLSQPHFEGSVRLPLTLLKMGLESPSGLSKNQSSIAQVKTPRLEVLFIPLKRSWSVDVQNDLAWVIWTFAAQVMAERRAGNQIGSLTPEH